MVDVSSSVSMIVDCATSVAAVAIASLLVFVGLKAFAMIKSMLYVPTGFEGYGSLDAVSDVGTADVSASPEGVTYRAATAEEQAQWDAITGGPDFSDTEPLWVNRDSPDALVGDAEDEWDRADREMEAADRAAMSPEALAERERDFDEYGRRRSDGGIG